MIENSAARSKIATISPTFADDRSSSLYDDILLPVVFTSECNHRKISAT